MESLIPVINKLQDVFATTGVREDVIKLPQIVVVGSQSAGKSSVMEGFVGRDFLPRGTGIVTRCPLLLQLTHMPVDDPKRREDQRFKDGDWATFQHLPNEVFTDFVKVHDEIENETNRLAKTSKGISDIPINLKIYSAKVVDLTLIDLPGLTNNPVGDQPANIKTMVRELVLQYIKNENSIILAVTPANTDFATSESLELAREVDANGDRTLCVLTKLDLMDRGTNAMEVLLGKLIPVKLGIIGVVNRSQEDIDSNKSMEECLRSEVDFLNRTYPTLASKNGIQFLATTLNKLLMQKIRKCLPGLKLRIADLIMECEKTLKSYGEPIDEKEKSKMLYKILNDFASAYISTIDGKGQNIKNTKIIGGARLCHVFYDIFGKRLEGIDPLDGLTDELIFGTTRNAYKKALKFLSITTPTKQFIEALLQIQHSHINTKHPDFLDAFSKEGGSKENASFGLLPPETFEEIIELSSRQKEGVEVVKGLIKNYFLVVRKSIQDNVPKAIMNFLVCYLQENLQTELAESLHKKADELMVENENIAQQRKDTSEMLDALNKANEIINEVRETDTC